jgi:hypothetical protein
MPHLTILDINFARKDTKQIEELTKLGNLRQKNLDLSVALRKQQKKEKPN